MSDTTDEAVNTEVVAQEPTVTESAPVEVKTPEVADSFDEVWADEAPAKDEPKAETVAPEPTTDKAEVPVADETQAEEQPRGKAETRKEQLNLEIRDLVAARNSLKSEVETLNAQAYQAPTVEDLVDQGYTELEAKVEAMQQRQQIDQFNSQVVDAQMTLESESSKVLRDFPIFDPNNEKYRPEVAAQAAELLGQNLVVDPNTGQIIGSKLSPYKLYATIASAAQASEVAGQIQGQRATEKMLANADSVGNAAPPKTKADPILEIWKD